MRVFEIVKGEVMSTKEMELTETLYQQNIFVRCEDGRELSVPVYVKLGNAEFFAEGDKVHVLLKDNLPIDIRRDR